MKLAGQFLRTLLLFALGGGTLHAENRTFDGTGNNLGHPNRGAANVAMIRFNYGPEFADLDGTMLTEPLRPNARDVSNAVFAQSTSVKNDRGLSDLAWAWGQFVAHDVSLTTTSNGPEANGVAPIAVLDPQDPLGPNPIPFTRANFEVTAVGCSRGPCPARTPINEATSYLDASHIYGSDAVRAAALRTAGGTGAKLLTSGGNLLPYNTAGLPNENRGPTPANQLFLAGDIRANENSLLLAFQTIFVREHNRLVDRIAAQQPGLNAEQQYQLARKIVGAEMQAITYREFLPALLGDGPAVPKAEDYAYSEDVDASITTAFGQAIFRLGHSMVSSQLRLVDEDGALADNLAVRNAFFNPNLLTNDPQIVEQLLRGAAYQRAEEIDTLVIDDLRSFLFGPPGAGGLDLAAINIQRGRDAGVPNLGELRDRHGLSRPQSFDQVTPDAALAQALVTLYDGNVNRLDAWVGALAEAHVDGASVGPLMKVMIENQFERLRDGDRLFYRSNEAGLYVDGVLDPQVAAIIDLDNVTLADIILANTSITDLQTNAFFYNPMPGDYNSDLLVDAADYTVWRDTMGDPASFDEWKESFTGNPQAGAANAGFTAVPEPSATALALTATALLLVRRRCGARDLVAREASTG